MIPPLAKNTIVECIISIFKAMRTTWAKHILVHRYITLLVSFSVGICLYAEICIAMYLYYSQQLGSETYDIYVQRSNYKIIL